MTPTTNKSKSKSSLAPCMVIMMLTIKYIGYLDDHTPETSLSGHPGCGSSRSEGGSEAQTGASHGEIADEIPEQTGDLEDGREEGEEGAAQLSCGSGSSVLAFMYFIDEEVHMYAGRVVGCDDATTPTPDDDSTREEGGLTPTEK